MDLLDACLTHGEWKRETVDFAGYCLELPCRHRCPQTQSRALSTWHGNAPECDAALPTRHNATFANAFTRPTDLFLIGDSVTWQVATTLTWMAKYNPRLNLRVTPCMMSVIPRRSDAIDAALQECVARGGSEAKPSRRALVVNVGMWYQPTAWCEPPYMRATSGCQCCQHATVNETHPEATTRPKGYPFGEGNLYSAMRRYSGTNVYSDYEHDVRLLTAALGRWQTARDHVLWMAIPPQHFPPSGTYDVAHLQLPAKDAQPQNFRDGRPSFNGSCLAEVPSAPQPRNDVALPIVNAAGIPVVNLWEALRRRGDLHKGHDCTHWCEPGDGVWLMASAVLASLATRLRA